MPRRWSLNKCCCSNDLFCMKCVALEEPHSQCCTQVLFGGITHWTVGLIATFMAVACTIAADTGAYAFGKTMGRTQLISISPKKTVEGAVGGLLCSNLVALAFWRFLGWPAQVSTSAMGFQSRCSSSTHCLNTIKPPAEVSLPIIYLH